VWVTLGKRAERSRRTGKASGTLRKPVARYIDRKQAAECGSFGRVFALTAPAKTGQ